MLNEVFNQIMDYELSPVSNEYSKVYKFYIKDIMYTVVFNEENITTKDIDDFGWSVEFANHDPKRKSWIQDPTDILNTGNSFVVFSTVIDIIKNFINKYHPRFLTFTANVNHPSRIKLYNSIIKKLVNQNKVTIDDSDPYHKKYIIDLK